MKQLNITALRRSFSSRKADEEAIDKAVDGRSMRATGRTEQFNFRCRDGYKSLAIELARQRGVTIGELMETLLDQAKGDGK